MTIDLDELERIAREWGAEDADWYPGVGPPVTLALIARIRELEATVRGEIGPGFSRRSQSLRAILERGAVLP
jgi:hypothetical protein